MAEAKRNLEILCQDPQSVAAMFAAHELFGVLKRAVRVPAGWAAMLRYREGDLAYKPAGTDIQAADIMEITFVRTGALTMTFEADNLSSKDGFSCAAGVRLQVAVAPQASEVAGFAKTVMGTACTADLATLQRYLHEPVTRAVTQFAADLPAETLMKHTDAQAFAALLSETLGPVCFAAGLVVQPGVQVRFESGSFDRVMAQRDAAAVARDEQKVQQQIQAALYHAQCQHLDHLRGLLEQLKQVAEDTPGVGLGPLLQTFNERERGQLYQTLWHAVPCTQPTQWLLAVTQGELLAFDPSELNEPARRVSFGDELGLLRSVKVQRGEGRQWILIGAAQGVYLADWERLDQPRAFGFTPGGPLRGGINSASLGGDRVLATHSEVGLLSWPIDGGAMELLLQEQTANARTVRFVRCEEGGRVWLTVDERIYAFPAGDWKAEQLREYAGSGSTISSLAVHREGVFAGTQAGDLWRWPIHRPSEPELLVRGTGRPVEGLAVVETAGVSHVVYADGSPGLNARVLGDAYVCRYEAAGRNLRWALAGEDLLIAVNDLRDRVLLWQPHHPQAPLRQVNIGRLCGQQVQDVERICGPAERSAKSA